MSLTKQTRVSLKGMSEEEKKERKKIQMREYMNKRRKEDPEFAEKQRELCTDRMKVLRQNPDYVEKEREYFKNYQRNIKREYNELKKSQNIAKI
jgi:hypothetical protein